MVQVLEILNQKLDRTLRVGRLVSLFATSSQDIGGAEWQLFSPGFERKYAQICLHRKCTWIALLNPFSMHRNHRAF